MKPELRNDIAELQRIQGWMTTEKGLALAEIVLDKKPKTAVELGVFGGRSMIAIALAMKENGIGKIYGIDPWHIDAAIEGDNDPANDNWWRNNINLHDIHRGCMDAITVRQLLPWCVVIRSKSDYSTELFQDGSVDLLHQDSNHSELVSCREVEMWHKKLSPNSTWVLDDTDWPTQSKAIQLIQDKGFAIKENTGRYIVFERS